jgi:O-antigen ligase
MHERFQPEASLTIGSTAVDIRLSDVAVLLVVAAAIVSALRLGAARLAPARALWLSGTALLAWLTFAALRPAALEDDGFADHLVTLAKLGEYALLAVAVPLLVRRRQDLAILLGALVLWSAVATAVAIVQLLGADIFAASSAGWRYPSFLGRHDLAAVSALAATVIATAIVVERARMPAARLVPVAGAAGIVGLILAGSVAAAGGFAIAAAGIVLAAHRRFKPSPRRIVALVAVVAVVVGGVTAVRSQALEDFLRFVGIHGEAEVEGVETYSQRTVLIYIGLRIFQDNPILGVGWQRSGRAEVFERYLADARARFPDEADEAFPAPERELGVQSLYVQMLADAGLIGLALLLAVGLGGLVLGWRTAAYASSPWAAGAGLAVMCALLTLAGEWAVVGIVPGIPIDAATCLLLGLAAAGAATVEDETGG